MSKIRCLFFLNLTLSFLLVFSSACTHTQPRQHGIQTESLAYIPARIAVLSCATWPEKASFFDMQLSNVSEKMQNNLCKEFDRFVLEGFNNQPYMRGLSPQVVSALLEREGKSDLLAKKPKLWLSQPYGCDNCSNIVEYYENKVAENNAWLSWLSEFSRSAYNSDALLVPFLNFVQEGRSENRGLQIAFRRAEITLLLIDTNNGQLMWSGGKLGLSQNQSLPEQLPSTELELPKWDGLYSRLFSEQVWLAFPGRQNY